VWLRLAACFEARRCTGRVPLDSPHGRNLARLSFVFVRSVVTALALAASACGGGSASIATSDELSSTSDNGLTSDASSTTQAPVTTTDAPITTEPTASAPATTLSSTGEPSDCERLAEFDDGDWFIVNDGVMGGRSQAEGAVEDGVLTWRGTIVTAGGGFSSIRGPIDGMFARATSLLLRIRTDGRAYELLANDALEGRGRVTHYVSIDATGGAWEEVSVSLTNMEARVFGNPVAADPFVPELATQVGVILADGVDGDFTFEIDWIDVCP